MMGSLVGEVGPFGCQTPSNVELHLLLSRARPWHSCLRGPESPSAGSVVDRERYQGGWMAVRLC